MGKEFGLPSKENIPPFLPQEKRQELNSLDRKNIDVPESEEDAEETSITNPKEAERIQQLRNQLQQNSLRRERRKMFAEKTGTMEKTTPIKETGTFSMLRKLWKVTPSDCRAALIGEFIFNPNALKDRYHEEETFQENLSNSWKK